MNSGNECNRLLSPITQQVSEWSVLGNRESPMTIGEIGRRVLLYFGLAIASLAAFSLVFPTLVYTGHTGHVSARWIALGVFTAGLFWVTIKQSKEYWCRLGFWFAMAGLLALHLLAFIAVLRSYPQWRGIWFMAIMIVEAGLFGAILYLLFGVENISTRKRRNNQANR